MKQIAAGRLGMVAARYGESAPLAGTCCNACRTCVSANVLTLGLTALAGLAVHARRLVRRARA
jgi:hypothetical protein